MSSKQNDTLRKQQPKEFSSSWQNFRKYDGDHRFSKSDKARGWTRRETDVKCAEPTDNDNKSPRTSTQDSRRQEEYGDDNARQNQTQNQHPNEDEEDDNNPMKHFRNRNRRGRKRFGFGYGFHKHDSSADNNSWHTRGFRKSRRQGSSSTRHQIDDDVKYLEEETGKHSAYSAHTSTFQAPKSDEPPTAVQSESRSEHIHIALPDKANKETEAKIASEAPEPVRDGAAGSANPNTLEQVGFDKKEKKADEDNYTYPYHYEYPTAAFKNWRSQSRGACKQLFENYHRYNKWKHRRGSRSRSRSFGWSDHRNRRSRSSRWNAHRDVFEYAHKKAPSGNRSASDTSANVTHGHTTKTHRRYSRHGEKDKDDHAANNPDQSPPRKRRQRSQRSYGIILFKYAFADKTGTNSQRQRQYLAIRRKNNIGFEEITRGKYDPMDLKFLLVLANDMTHTERLRLLTATDFRPLWYSVWHDLLKQEDTDSDEYQLAERNFWQLQRGFYVDVDSEAARALTLPAEELLREYDVNNNDRCTCVRENEKTTTAERSSTCSVCGRDRKTSESQTNSSGESGDKRDDPSFSDSQSHSQSCSWASGDDDDTSTTSYKEADHYDLEPDAAVATSNAPDRDKLIKNTNAIVSLPARDSAGSRVLVSWKTIFDRVVTDYSHPNVEFPKGRKDNSRNETSIECAQRETCEETTVDASRYQMKHLQPVHETFTGLNNVRYRYTYYVAELKSDASDCVHIDGDSVSQLNEVSDVGWYTFEELLNAIRPTDIARKRALTKVHQTLNEECDVPTDHSITRTQDAKTSTPR
jgi:8-oxo-dGTP pyrophosphatase MutT (NUDIX family)